MAVLGFDLSPLKEALGNLQQSIRQGVQEQQPQGGPGDYLGYLGGLAQPASGPSLAMQTLGQASQRAPQSADFLGQLSAYAGQQAGLGGPAMTLLTNLYQGGNAITGGVQKTWSDLSAYGDRLAYNAQQAAASSGQNTGPGSSPKPGPAPSAAPGGGPSAGLDPGIAQWDSQTQQTFGDLGGWVPSAMLAIIQHESGGKPTAYNSAGDAWGLFQQLHLNSNDPQVQFQAARQLAQEKLASIQQSYAANGINPDERTRARDLFLAWAGHFDYQTGQPNAGSRDIGSNQDYQSFLGEIMPMYDHIVAGRQQAPASTGGGGLQTLFGGATPPVMQEFGTTDYSQGHPDTYAYGNAYGLVGSQHPGVDYGMPVGTRLNVPVSGTVSVVGNDHGSGYYYSDVGHNQDPDHSGELAITLPNGDIVILGHLSRIDLQVGQQVNAGMLAGLSGGSDGDHLHLEVRVRDPSMSSGYRIVDPRIYFGGR